MGTVSTGLKAKIQTSLGAGTAVVGAADGIDLILEAAPVLLSTSLPVSLYACLPSGEVYSKITGHKASPPRLTLAPSLRVSILNDSIGTAGPDGWIDYQQFKLGVIEAGAVELANVDGALDGLVNLYGWGGTVATWKVVRHGDAYTSAETVIPGVFAGEPTFDTDRIRMELRSAGADLDAPVQTATFSGAGAWEGGDDLAGKLKPVVLGVRRFVPGTLVDFANLRYVVSDAVSGINALVAGYEHGFPAGGAWTLQAANGGFTLPNAPQGRVDAWIQGEKFNAGAYSNEQGRIIGELLSRAGSPIGLNATDRGNFANVAGIYLPTDQSVPLGQALDTMRLPLGIMYPEQDGSQWRLKAIAVPTSPTVTYDNTADGDKPIARLLEARIASQPVWRVRVGYQQFESTLPDSRALSASLREAQANEWRWASVEDAAVKVKYPNALSLSIRSPLDSKAQAETRAAEALAIFKRRCWRFRFELAHKWFHSWIGTEVLVRMDRGKDASGSVVPLYNLGELAMLQTGIELTAGASLRSSSYVMECWAPEP